MSDFEGVREGTLPPKAFVFIGSKRKAAATHVEIARSADGKVQRLAVSVSA